MFIKTIKKQGSAKLIVKKSVFYSYIYPISNKNQIKNILLEIKKKHKQAKHIAYAYKISSFNKVDSSNCASTLNNEERYSDDGEPSKTAGYPLLRIINNNNLTNILIIVARVFGGIKLGMSGLMNAYSSAGELLLQEVKIINEEVCEIIQINTTLDKYSELEILLKKNSISYHSEFSNNSVKVKINISPEKRELLARWI